MRKSLVLILLAAGSLVVGGGSTLCYAAEDANPQAVAAPEATPSQLSQRKMRQLTQRKKHPLSQRKMHRMQKTGGQTPGQSAAQEEQSQERTDGAPSQRSMRQKLREANPAPATDSTESR